MSNMPVRGGQDGISVLASGQAREAGDKPYNEKSRRIVPAFSLERADLPWSGASARRVLNAV